MNRIACYCVLALMLGAFTVVVTPTISFAIENYTGTPSPVAPFPSPLIPSPTQVTGKEYTDMPNISTIPAIATVDSGQVIAWDGLGGVADSIADFIAGDGDEGVDVDAIANHLDVLLGERFAPDGVRGNASALLVSHTGDGDGTKPLYTESIAGGTAVWATDAMINGHDPIVELDGIEIWGADGAAADDSDRYSLLGDPGGISVFLPGGAGYITTGMIATAIGHPEYQSNLDLDGLMLNDDGDAIWGNSPADQMIFSIRPIGVFDGGEVWDWEPALDGPGPAPFLFHGGHFWGTAFDVMAAFDVDNENIDGLEGLSYIPEPSSLTLVAIGMAALGLVYRRRRSR